MLELRNGKTIIIGSINTGHFIVLFEHGTKFKMIKSVKAHNSKYINCIIELNNHRIVSVGKTTINLWSPNFKLINSYSCEDQIYDLQQISDENLVCRTKTTGFIFNLLTGIEVQRFPSDGKYNI